MKVDELKDLQATNEAVSEKLLDILEEQKAMEERLAANKKEALRDHFAAHALGALIGLDRSDCSYEDDARVAYKYADAMLKAREQ